MHVIGKIKGSEIINEYKIKNNEIINKKYEC